MPRLRCCLRGFRKLLAGLLFACLGLQAAAAEKRSYVLAVAPSMPPVVTHKTWTPFIEKLSKDSGLTIDLKLYETFPAFMADCEQGLPDFMFAPPNLFFLAHQQQKYIPLVRSSVSFCGQVFVRKDSPFQTVRDLKGRTIAFVGPKNVCSVITRHAFATGQGLIDYNTMYSGSTINVAKSVLLGKVDAGAMLDSALMAESRERDGDFRILLKTAPIAPHPLAAHPRVPPAVRDEVAQAILAMAATAPGKPLLGTVRLADPMKADFKRDYAHFDDAVYERIQRQTEK